MKEIEIWIRVPESYIKAGALKHRAVYLITIEAIDFAHAIIKHSNSSYMFGLFLNYRTTIKKVKVKGKIEIVETTKPYYLNLPLFETGKEALK